MSLLMHGNDIVTLASNFVNTKNRGERHNGRPINDTLISVSSLDNKKTVMNLTVET